MLAGYGLEVPCFYRFYGPEPYIRILQELLSSLWTNIVELVVKDRHGVKVYRGKCHVRAMPTFR